jgi:hypothetical protein
MDSTAQRAKRDADWLVHASCYSDAVDDLWRLVPAASIAR